MTTERDPRPLSDALNRLMGSMRAPSVDVLDAVFNRWGDIVGPDVAMHTRPSAIDGDLLVIVVDEPTWASEVRWLEAELLARLAEAVGSDRIQRLSVRVERRE